MACVYDEPQFTQKNTEMVSHDIILFCTKLVQVIYANCCQIWKLQKYSQMLLPSLFVGAVCFLLIVPKFQARHRVIYSTVPNFEPVRSLGTTIFLLQHKFKYMYLIIFNFRCIWIYITNCVRWWWWIAKHSPITQAIISSINHQSLLPTMTV